MSQSPHRHSTLPISSARTMARQFLLVQLYWTVGMLVTLSNCNDNTVLSSQYRRLVNQKSQQDLKTIKPVRGWLQCGSMCSRMGLACLGYNLITNPKNDSSPYTCEMMSLPFVDFLKSEDNDCVYYDLRMQGGDLTIRNDACLPSNDDVIKLDVSLDQCWQECLAAGAANCSSVDYNHNTQKCFFSRSSLADAGMSLTEPCTAGEPKKDMKSYTYIERRFVDEMNENLEPATNDSSGSF